MIGIVTKNSKPHFARLHPAAPTGAVAGRLALRKKKLPQNSAPPRWTGCPGRRSSVGLPATLSVVKNG